MPSTKFERNIFFEKIEQPLMMMARELFNQVSSAKKGPEIINPNAESVIKEVFGDSVLCVVTPDLVVLPFVDNHFLEELKKAKNGILMVAFQEAIKLRTLIALKKICEAKAVELSPNILDRNGFNPDYPIGEIESGIRGELSKLINGTHFLQKKFAENQKPPTKGEQNQMFNESLGGGMVNPHVLIIEKSTNSAHQILEENNLAPASVVSKIATAVGGIALLASCAPAPEVSMTEEVYKIEETENPSEYAVEETKQLPPEATKEIEVESSQPQELKEQVNVEDELFYGDGYEAGKTEAVISSADFYRIFGDDEEKNNQLRQEIFNNVVEKVIQIIKTGAKFSQIGIPDFLTRREVEEAVKEQLNLKSLSTEIVSMQKFDTTNKGRSIAVVVHAGLGGWTTAIWTDPRIVKWSDGSNQIQGSIVTLMESGDQLLLYTIPAQEISGGGVAVAIVPGGSAVLVRLGTDRQFVTAIYKQEIGEWIKNPLPVPESAKLPEIQANVARWVESELAREGVYAQLVGKNDFLEIHYALNTKTLSNWEGEFVDENRFMDGWMQGLHARMVETGDFSGDYESFKAYLKNGGKIIMSDMSAVNAETGTPEMVNGMEINEIWIVVTSTNPETVVGETMPRVSKRYGVGINSLSMEYVIDPQNPQRLLIIEFLPKGVLEAQSGSYFNEMAMLYPFVAVVTTQTEWQKYSVLIYDQYRFDYTRVSSDINNWRPIKIFYSTIDLLFYVGDGRYESGGSSMNWILIDLNE